MFFGRKKTVSVFLLTITMVLPVIAQSKLPLDISIVPGVEIPLGPLSSAGNKVFDTGGSVSLNGTYYLPSCSNVFARGLLDVAFIPETNDDTLTIFSPGVGIGYRFSPGSSLEIETCLAAGYGLGLNQGETSMAGGLAFAKADLNAGFRLSSSLLLSGGGSFQYNEAFYGIKAYLSATFSLGGGGGRSRLEIEGINLLPVFPVFHKYYDENPLGSFSLRNEENGTISKLQVSFLMREYMDSPKICLEVPQLKKGESVRVPILALFRNDLLNLTENTKISAEIKVSYIYQDKEISGGFNDSFRVYHRNAMTWDDDRKAAAFITPKDPQILLYGKKIGSEIRNQGPVTMSLKFREALGLFEFMREYGLKYVVDPVSSYAELSENNVAVDYLQFPAQTFTYSSGDCDDLSICYAALLESLGTETAFITVPGHIFLAFKPEIPEEQVLQHFDSAANLIIRDGEVWIPIEVTAVQEGFLKAWNLGAAEWREASAKNNAGFWPVHEAWQLYEPVGINDSAFIISETNISAIMGGYNAEYSRFVGQVTDSRISELRRQINSRNRAMILNRTGTIYARYGLYDKASLEFREAAGLGYVPAMINIGNIHFLGNNLQLAIEYYERALKTNPRETAAMAGLARTYNKIGSPERVEEFYGKLKSLNPSLAEKLSYLDHRSDNLGRASDLDSLIMASFEWEE